MSGEPSVRAVLETVLRIIDELFESDELTAVQVERTTPDAGGPRIVVRLRVGDEEFWDPYWEPGWPPDSDLVRRLATHLEDWIAESSFGWGEQRLLIGR